MTPIDWIRSPYIGVIFNKSHYSLGRSKNMFYNGNFTMGNSEANNANNSLGDYYASNRSPAIINHNKDNKTVVQDLEIGRVFVEYKDKLVIIDGENKKEHEYLIPKTKVHRYGDMRVYFNLSEESLKEFEI